jgi:hypothetical protein
METPELADFPTLNGLAKEDSSRRLVNYMTEDLRLNEPRHEADAGSWFLEMGHILAHIEVNLREHPNPPAYVRKALRHEELRQWRERKEWESCLVGEVFDVPQNADERRNAVRNVEAAEITSIDSQQWKAKLKLPPDQARALEAKINGLDLQSSGAAESLGWNPARLARVRRSLEPGRKCGKAVRDHFAAYKPTENSSN